MTSIYVLGIIVVAIAHADAFHFNPVMRLFGYRFYSVRNREGLSLLLISRRDLHRNHEEVQTVSDGKILFPANKVESKKVLQFLNEELYRGPITETLYETNSKRAAS